MPFCTGCGTHVDAADRFCRACGSAQPNDAGADGSYGDAPQASIMRDIEPLIIRGKKIEAIKLYRQMTRADLREAKSAVEAHEEELRRRGMLERR